MQFPPLSCYLVHLRHKYSLQHPILNHLQPTFFSQCKWPSFTPIQNKTQHYSSWIIIIIIIIILMTNVKFLPYKLKHKLHMSIHVRIPWRWWTSIFETCWSIDEQIKNAVQQVGGKFYVRYKHVINFDIHKPFLGGVCWCRKLEAGWEYKNRQRTRIHEIPSLLRASGIFPWLQYSDWRSWS